MRRRLRTLRRDWAWRGSRQGARGWYGAGQTPAEGLVDAVLQLAGAARRLGLAAAAGDVRALEPAEPRTAVPSCVLFAVLCAEFCGSKTEGTAKSGHFKLFAILGAEVIMIVT
jgi:hypothetical protein